MLFALMAWDKEGALSVRMQNRPDHLTYLENSNLVRQAGPFIDKGGEPCGSLIILETDSMAAAQEWVKNDPYAKAGLFRDFKIIEWKRVIDA
ncbi:MAG TPA: hypothetical protein DCE52_15005 [Rhodobacteraceae bacterium]|nr:YciI family protein [Alphaproteobacteria bacterium]HAB39278.1 hypothetical protein [Paracoccaceae bacterium]